MDTALWVVQILLALAFFMTGLMKATQPIDKLEQRIPARRFGTQEEAVEAVLFLLAGGTYTTGEVLRVDGGRGLA